jgi:zinc transporter ZupT
MPVGGLERAFLEAELSVWPRVLSAAVLCLSSAAGVVPALLHEPASASASSVLRLKAFSGGVMLSLAFLHLLADACSRLSHFSYPVAPACALAGWLFMHAIEVFSADLAEAARRAARKGGAGGRKGSDDECTGDELPQAGRAGNDAEHGGHAHAHFVPPFSKKVLTAQLLEWSVLVHSLIIGADLGIQSSGGLAAMTLVLALHQLFEGVSLGSVVADCGDALSRSHRVQLAVAFCATTPAGVLLGIALSRSSTGGADSSASLITGVLDGVCAGMLMQMSSALLGEELSRAEALADPAAGSALKRELFALSCAGVGVMAVLAVWA